MKYGQSVEEDWIPKVFYRACEIGAGLFRPHFKPTARFTKKMRNLILIASKFRLHLKQSILKHHDLSWRLVPDVVVYRLLTENFS